MPTPPFSLTIHSLIPPSLPPQPDLADVPAKAYKSSLIAGPAAATSSLLFTLHLPNARSNNPLFPADRLQVVFTFEGTGQIFLPRVLTGEDFDPVGEGGDGDGSDGGTLYTAQVAADEVPRVKVNEGASTTATISLFAWKGEKLLGKWDIGQIEGLGLTGLKSEEIHKRRVQQWKEEGRKGVV